MKEKYKDKLCQEGYGKPSEKKKLKHPLFYVQTKQYWDEKKKREDKKLERTV
jgi:hypothetical protein